MKKPFCLALPLVLLLLGGCSSVKLPDLSGAPSEDDVKRYGPYCEQMGNAKGSTQFDACVKRQRGIYAR